MDYRYEIISGKPLDVEAFIGATLDLGVEWFDVNHPLGPPHPFSSKLELGDWQCESLQMAAKDHNVLIYPIAAGRKGKNPMPKSHPMAYNEVNFVEPGRIEPPTTIVERVRQNLRSLFTTKKGTSNG